MFAFLLKNTKQNYSVSVGRSKDRVLRGGRFYCKGRTIRKLMGGRGGRAKYKKKNSRKGKLNLKKFLHAN